jgi:hypothetical protein
LLLLLLLRRRRLLLLLSLPCHAISKGALRGCPLLIEQGARAFVFKGSQ